MKKYSAEVVPTSQIDAYYAKLKPINGSSKCVLSNFCPSLVLGYIVWKGLEKLEKVVTKIIARTFCNIPYHFFFTFLLFNPC